jgi:hypothetical protein
MKQLSCFLLLGVGLLLLAPVSFASDGTKITKECSYDVGDINLNVASYEVSFESVVSHNFVFVSSDFTFVDAPALEGPADVGKRISEFGTLADIFVLYNRSTKYPDINYWILYKKDLDFKLTNTLNSKAPECLCRYKC